MYSERSDKYYTGSTKDLDKRLTRHNKGHMRSTKAGAPWKVVYYEEFGTRSEAYQREMQIKKKKSRKYIEWLISKQE